MSALVKLYYSGHHDKAFDTAIAEIERLRSYRDSIASVQNRLEVVEIENAKLQKALELQKQASRDVAATYNEQEAEIERLEHMQANLHGHIKRLEDENSKLRAEIERSHNAILQRDDGG